MQPNGRVIRVAKEHNAIKVSGDGIPTALLFPESENKFFIQDFNVQLEFIRNELEQAFHMLIYENGIEIMDIKKIQ